MRLIDMAERAGFLADLATLAQIEQLRLLLDLLETGKRKEGEKLLLSIEKDMLPEPETVDNVGQKEKSKKS